MELLDPRWAPMRLASPSLVVPERLLELWETWHICPMKTRRQTEPLQHAPVREVSYRINPMSSQVIPARF